MLTLFFVLPCYNEREMLPLSAPILRDKLEDLIGRGEVSPESRIVFVDDGSKDGTWDIICGLHRENRLFRGIKLAHNRGQQNALLAGLMTVRTECDAVITMDADLQDDINAVDEMLQRCREGAQIVYGVRSDRDRDSFFKRTTAHAFYRIMRFMGAEIIYDHADYRLMTRRALDALSEYGEVNLFLRGIVPSIGFSTARVLYSRQERKAGKTKYPLKKMLTFSLDGITSFSVRPMRLITSAGLLIFIVSLVLLIYSLVRHLCGETVTGWTSTVISIWAVGGLQMLCIGVIGEYIGRIYLETKQRPRYTVEEYLSDGDRSL